MTIKQHAGNFVVHYGPRAVNSVNSNSYPTEIIYQVPVCPNVTRSTLFRLSYSGQVGASCIYTSGRNVERPALVAVPEHYHRPHPKPCPWQNHGNPSALHSLGTGGKQEKGEMNTRIPANISVNLISLHPRSLSKYAATLSRRQNLFGGYNSARFNSKFSQAFLLIGRSELSHR